MGFRLRLLLRHLDLFVLSSICSTLCLTTSEVIRRLGTSAFSLLLFLLALIAILVVQVIQLPLLEGLDALPQRFLRLQIQIQIGTHLQLFLDNVVIEHFTI